MSLTSTQLTTEIKALVGRPNDTVLITDVRVNRFINQAQDYIVEHCPGLLDTNTTSTSTTCVSDQIDYTVGSYDPTVCHLLDIWYWDGADSFLMDFQPPDEFDARYPDPTNTEKTPQKPYAWTRRRRREFTIAPRPSTDYAGKTLRVQYTGYADDITGASTSSIINVDEGIILYSVSKCWEAIGDLPKSLVWWKRFTNIEDPANLGWLEEFQRLNNTMTAWSGNILFDGY